MPQVSEWTLQTTSATSNPEMGKILGQLDASKLPSLTHSKGTGDKIAGSGTKERRLPHFFWKGRVL